MKSDQHSALLLGLLTAMAGMGSLLATVQEPPRSRPNLSYTKPVPVTPPTRMREWRYLVIHHSGASTGNEAILQAEHLKKGMENGMAYHFLIGNGSTGLGDGAVVEGRRWKYQLQGGHSHQDHLNEYGIGICLIGNFNRKRPSSSQIRALAKLVLELQKKFNIPDENIHGHGQFYGEDSDCPGKQFPWTNFWAQVDMLYTDLATGSATNQALVVTPPTLR